MQEAVSKSISLEPRRLDTPARETLLAHYAQTEKFSRIILTVEALAGLAILGWMIQSGAYSFGWLPWLAFGLGSLGVFRWFLHHVFLNKKKLEDIRADAMFGEHTRDSLLRLTNNVFTRLGLKAGAAPVFLTRAKDVNAHAVRCELWPGLHLFNGVFLNRSILHLLDECELASVVGHELGHVFPYAPLLSRCYIVHALFAGLASFAVVALFPHPAVAVLSAVAILWLLDLIIAFPHLRLSRGIEFLCDDFGAQAAGLLPALSSEFKIATEQETRQRLLLRMLQARKEGLRLNLNDLAEAYEEAIPFGKADPDSFEREFRKLTSERQRSSKEISVGGFLNHLQDNANSDDAVEEQIAELELIQRLPCLSIERGAYLRGSQGWSMQAAEHLANFISQNPSRLLFLSPEEINDRASTHPNASRRILFLWKNRSHYPM